MDSYVATGVKHLFLCTYVGSLCAYFIYCVIMQYSYKHIQL